MKEMKKTLAIILTSILMASVAASCSADKTPTRTSSTSRERETTTTTTSEETTTTTSQAITVVEPFPAGGATLTSGSYAMTPEVEAKYNEAFAEVEELPGTPVAIVTASEDKYLIIEMGDTMSYSGMDCYHIVEVGDSGRGAYFNRLEYLDVQIGFGVDDSILNPAEVYDLNNDQIATYEEYAPSDCGDAFMYIAENAHQQVFLADNGNTLSVVSIDDQGNSEVLTTYDYSDWA